MKNCPNCQAPMQDDATFCTACGARQMPAAPAQPVTPPAPPQPPVPPIYSYAPAPKQPISVGAWIGRSLIPCIPVVGSIVYLVMLFIWMGDESKEDSFRNWAKAQLIMMLIGVVLAIGLVVLMAVLGISLAETMY